MSSYGIIIGLIAAFVSGIAMHSGTGFLLGLIAGYSLGALIQLSARVDKLQQQLHKLATPSPRPPAAAATQSPLAQKSPALSLELELPSEPAVTRPVSPPQAAAETRPTAPSIAAAMQSRAPSPTVAPLREDNLFDKLSGKVKAFFTDGNVVVKVGLLVLFVGVGFLLKYAAAHAMLPVQLRVAGIAIGGIALTIFGWRLRADKPVYALLLQGGGVGVLYLTVFGAAKLYHLLPLGFAFVIMVALVVLSAILAVLQNSRHLALYGAAGGFLAPILASTGGGSHIMLFSYYALLNLGIVGIAWYRSWRELNLLGFVFTFVIGMLWAARFYRPEFLSSVEPFLILYFLMFVTVSVLFAYRQPPQLKGYVDSSLVFGVPIVAFTLQAALVQNIEYGISFSALGFSAFYIVLAASLWSRGPAGMRLLTEAFLAMGVVFGSMAIPLALDGRWTSAAWALEGAAIVWVGVRQRRVLARNFGLLLQFGSGFFYLRDLHAAIPDWPIINGIFLGAMVVSLAGLFSSYYLYRHADRLRSWEQGFPTPLLIWGLCWWLGAGIHEIREFLSPRQLRFNVFLAFVTGSLVLARYLQERLNWKTLRFPVLGQIYVMIFALWLLLTARVSHPLAWYGWLCWPFGFAALYYFLYSYRDRVKEGVLKWQHILGLWLLVAFVTWEASWLFTHWIAGATWRGMMLGLVPAIFMLLLLTRGRALRWPVAEHYAWYAGYAAMPIMVILGLVALAMGLLHEGNPRPISYVPLLNPVDMMVGFIVYLLILWPRLLEKRAPEMTRLVNRQVIMYLVGGGCFLWLNGIIARTIHHWFGVAHNLHALSRSAIFQASVSVIWTLTAMLIMYLASRRGRRQSWFVGLGLFLITVGKLFLVDIADKNELTMILSLIIVAIVAIVFGYYLSPLPPRREEKS